MNKKFRIAIAGIRGVGGFVGGKLAGRFPPGSDIEIIFIARGENEKVICSNGLKLITNEDEQIVYPSLVTHQPEKAGPLDLLLFCVKNCSRFCIKKINKYRNISDCNQRIIFISYG